MLRVCRVRTISGDRKDWPSLVPDYFRFIAGFASPIVLLFAFWLPVHAQEFDPEQVVFPITDFKPDIQFLAPFSIKFGTGFCLDENCRFVGTNYHVAKIMGKYVRIKGVFSAQRYLDSGADDIGVENVNFIGGGSLKLMPTHDLAIYQMRRPLKKFHGVGFDVDDLENGREVDIYAYPLNLNPKRRLVRWHGKFIGTNREGLLSFSYEEGRVRCGASGGIVVDSKTKKIVGILNSVDAGKERIAFAVPVKELSAFVTRAQPYLQAKLFPKTVFVSPVTPDLYPPYIWPRESFAQRLPEPPEIVSLRRTAQDLVDSMRNFAASETFSWGHDNREPNLTEAYDTFILDGTQRWRRTRDGKWFYNDSPLPRFWVNSSIGTGDQWIHLPLMVGTELNLKIHRASDAVVGGRIVHVFQYAASAEDRVCPIKYFGTYRTTTTYYDCHGEVWMGESGTILRISEAIDDARPLRRFWAVMTYGRLLKDGKEYLLPVTFETQAQREKTDWCRGLFTDYDMFKAKARLLPQSEAERISALGTR